MVVGVDNPSGITGGSIIRIFFETGLFLIKGALFIHFFAVEAFVGELIMFFAFRINIIV